VLLAHLPPLIRKNPKFRARVKGLPPKIKAAILSSEIASHIVYHGGWKINLERELKEFVKKEFN
jgi:hypothetical protein